MPRTPNLFNNYFSLETTFFTETRKKKEQFQPLGAEAGKNEIQQNFIKSTIGAGVPKMGFRVAVDQTGFFESNCFKG